MEFEVFEIIVRKDGVIIKLSQNGNDGKILQGLTLERLHPCEIPKVGDIFVLGRKSD